MSRKWENSDFTKEAKHHGGPDGFREHYKREGELQGIRETLIAILIFFFTLGICKLVKICRERIRKRKNRKIIDMPNKITDNMTHECPNCHCELTGREYISNSDKYTHMICTHCGHSTPTLKHGEFSLPFPRR